MNVTAVSKANVSTDNHKNILLQPDINHLNASSSGVLEKACIFCRCVTKWKDKEPLGACEEVEAAEKIKDATTKLKDGKMIRKIGN